MTRLHELDAHISPRLSFGSLEEQAVDFRGDVADVLGPVFFVGLDAPAHQWVEKIREPSILLVSWSRWHFIPGKRLQVIKRLVACARVEQHHSNAVYVAAVVVALHLGFPELGRLPHDGTCGGRKHELPITMLIPHIVQLHIRGDTEVDDFYAPTTIGHDEVFWLDVSVQHAVAVHALDCAAELAEHREDFPVVVGAWGFANERTEILPIEVLHH